MSFQPDYRHVEAAARNRRPARLPLYEHIICAEVMEPVLDVRFAGLLEGDAADVGEFFRHYCRFFQEMTFDTVSWESTPIAVMPDGGAGIVGKKPGVIQSRADFEAFDWDEVARRFWEMASPQYDALAAALPPGMKAIGGVANGCFEISEELVGLESLAYLQVDDPELFADLYVKIGDLMLGLWQTFLRRYGDLYAVCRFGDDLGFKSGTLTTPANIRVHLLPQYRRIIDIIHAAGKPFLWHSCGNIFEIMDDAIGCGIDAKHSNEDAIAPFETWIGRYGDRIGLFGGIDVDILCRYQPDEVFEIVCERGARYRAQAQGYALGSGNSIPGYVPAEGFLAMVRAVQELRRREGTS